MISLSQLLSQPEEEEKVTHTSVPDYDSNQHQKPLIEDRSTLLLQNEDINTAIEPQRKSNLSA